MYDRRPPDHRRFYRPPHLRGPSRYGSARDGGGVVRPRLPDLPLRHGHGFRPRRRRGGPRVPRFPNRIGPFSRRGFRCRLSLRRGFCCCPSRIGPFSRRGFRCRLSLRCGFCCCPSRIGLFSCRGFRCRLSLRCGFCCCPSRIGLFSCCGFRFGLFSGTALSAHADARFAAGRRNSFPGTGEPLPGRGPRTLPACAGCRRP